MELFDILGYFFLGAVFFTFGLLVLFRQDTHVGIGGGRTAGSPLFVTKIHGLAAKILGISLILGGLLVMLPSVLSMFGNYSPTSSLYRLPFIGIVLMIFGVFFSVLIQKLISLGAKLGKSSKSVDNND